MFSIYYRYFVQHLCKLHPKEELQSAYHHYPSRLTSLKHHGNVQMAFLCKCTFLLDQILNAILQMQIMESNFLTFSRTKTFPLSTPPPIRIPHGCPGDLRSSIVIISLGILKFSVAFCGKNKVI